MDASILVLLVVIGLSVWACIWSHLAFMRWEARENRKVRALEAIAAGKKERASSDVPEWAATR